MNYVKTLLFFIICITFAGCSKVTLNTQPKTTYNPNKVNSISSYKLNSSVNLKSWHFFSSNLSNTTLNYKISDNHFDLKLIRKISLGSSYSAYDIVPNVVVNNNILYSISKSGYLYKVDLKSFKTINKYKIKYLKNSIPTSLAYSNSDILITSNYGDIISVDSIDGSENWHVSLGYPIQSASVIDGNKLFVIANNSVYAVDLFSQNIIWQKQGVIRGSSISKLFTPTIYQTFLIVPFNNGKLSFFRKENGNLLWEKKDYSKSNLIGNAMLASPVLVNKDQSLLVGNYSNKIQLVSLLNGKTMWQFNEIGFINNPVIINNHAFVLTTNMSVYNIDTSDGKYFWNLKLPIVSKNINSLNWFGPLLVNNMLMIYNSSGLFYFISPQSGKIIKTIKIKLALFDKISNPPLIINKQIILFSLKSNLYVLN